MMKRITSLLAAAFVASVGLAPAWAQDQREDYTSHVKNAGFAEGASTLVGDTAHSGGRGVIVSPKDWKLTMSDHYAGWDRQFLSYSEFENTSVDAFQTPRLMPSDGDDGFYFHAITGGQAPTKPYSMLQTINTLPKGKYTLVYDAVYYSIAANEVQQPAMQVESGSGVKSKNFFVSEGEPTEWSTDSVEFTVINDNEDVTFGMYYAIKTSLEQHVYMDNFRLFRTGELSDADVLEGVYAATDDARMYLEGMEYEQYLLSDWVEKIQRLYEWNDDFTLAEAFAYEKELNAFVAELEELADLHDSLDILATREKAFIAETNFPGAADYQAVIDKLTEMYNGQHDIDQAKALITELADATYAYKVSGLSEAASYDNPVDATFLITNPTIDATTGRQDPEAAPGWYIEATGTGQPYIYSGQTFAKTETEDQISTGTYFNTWDGTMGKSKYTATQTITGLPMGIYRIKALMESDGGNVFLFGNVDGAYFSTNANKNYGDYRFDTITVDNIPVTNGNLQIGVTSNADALWGGPASTSFYFAADNFELYYCGTDMSVLNDLLNAKIKEAEELLNAGTSMLKGDKTAIEAIIAKAKEVAAGTDIPAISEQISILGTLPVTIEESAAAIESVQLEQTIAQEIYDADNKYFEEVEKTALAEVLAAATTWISADESVVGEADGMIEEIKAALLAAQKSSLPNKIKEGACDATFMIVNPDLEEGAIGWHAVKGNTNYELPFQYFEDGASNSLFFWADKVDGSAPAFENRQTIYNLPNGKYRVTAQGFYGAADPYETRSRLPNDSVVFFAYGDVNDEVQVNMYTQRFLDGDTIERDASSDLPLLDDDGNLIYKPFFDGRKVHYELEVTVTHGWLRIGFKSIGQINCGRAQIDDFTLTYLEEGPELPYPDAIEDVNADENAVKAYAVNGKIVVESEQPYTITSVSGQTYENDAQFAPGVYVVKTANAAVKVVVD